MTETPLLLTVPEAAPLMGVSVSTLWLMVSKRQIDSIAIPAAKGSGQRPMRRISRAAIDAWIETHTVAAVPE